MDWTIVVLIVLLLAVVLLCILLWSRTNNGKERRELQEMQLHNREVIEEMSNRINKELMQFQHLLHQGMQQDFHMLREDTTQRLFSMEKSMNASLQVQLEQTGKAFTSMMSEVSSMKETQKHLGALSMDIQNLQGILNDKKTRGIYGEIELYALLDQVMGGHTLRYGKQVKLSNGTIADAVLYGGGTMPMIAIDSKFPLENYRRLQETGRGKEELQKAQNTFIMDVKKHINAISNKYIISQETADFAYLFLPAESLFSYIHASCPQLVEYGFKEHVYLVSPTTLMAYITAIKAIYLNQRRNNNIVAIQQELKKLSQEFERFEKRYTLVANDFDRVYQDMRNMAITADKLNKRFAAIVNVELEEEENEDDASEAAEFA